MNALDYFMNFHKCSSRQDLGKLIILFGSDLQIPPHQCAHPNKKIFSHIKEIKILDLIPPSTYQHLICLCIANKIDNSFSNESLFEDGNIYNEFFYLHLEDIDICLPNENENTCKCTKQLLGKEN